MASHLKKTISNALPCRKCPFIDQRSLQYASGATWWRFSIGWLVTDHSGHKPKRPQPKGYKPKRPQTGTATNWNSHKPEDYKPKWPHTETATNRNGHRKWRKTTTATNRNGHTRWYPNILKGTCMTSGLQNTSVNNAFRHVTIFA